MVLHPCNTVPYLIITMDVVKLASLGMELGHTGEGLHKFILEQNIARDLRAQERERLDKERELVQYKMTMMKIESGANESQQRSHPNYILSLKGRMIWIISFTGLKGMHQHKDGNGKQIGQLISINLGLKVTCWIF